MRPTNSMKSAAKMRTVMLSAAALLALAGGAFGQQKVTVGVGHMCCQSCKTAAAAALAKVAGDVSIDGKAVSMTLKDNDILPALTALRNGGFPASKLDVGAKPVVIGVSHLCCGKCRTGLQSALADAKIESLDMDAVKIGTDDVIVKAKDGKSLDVMAVIEAMEKGGFSAKKVTVGAGTAAKPTARKIARR